MRAPGWSGDQIAIDMRPIHWNVDEFAPGLAHLWFHSGIGAYSLAFDRAGCRQNLGPVADRRDRFRRI